ncbi:MAG: hypothetical protein ACK5O7_02680 [Holosporales bacterium]
MHDNSQRTLPDFDRDEEVMVALERYFLLHTLSRPLPAPRWAEW